MSAPLAIIDSRKATGRDRQAPFATPQPAMDAPLPDAVFLDGLLEYVAWSTGRGTLRRALAQLALYFGASRGHLVCLDGESGRVRVSPEALSRTGTETARRVKAAVRDNDHLRRGEVAIVRDARAVLPDADGGGSSADIILCLQSGDARKLFLAFALIGPAGAACEAAARRAAILLAEAHAKCDPAIVEAAFDAAERAARKAAQKAAPQAMPKILDHANPYGLTAAEMRVCDAVSRGLSVKGAAFELGRSANTVRTHLRNIYIKTEMNGYFALAHALISQSSDGAERFAA